MDWILNIVVMRLLQLPPEVTREGDLLVAKTAWFAHFLYLGYGSRKVVIDPHKKVIILRKRFAWFVLNEDTYRFDQVLNVIAGYDDWSFSNLSLTGAYQDRGAWTVELRLTTGERIMLFRYYMQGDFINDGFFPDAMYWGDMLEAALAKGNSYTHSEAFANMVAGMIGTRVYAD